jgi:hypothetical protein
MGRRGGKRKLFRVVNLKDGDIYIVCHVGRRRSAGCRISRLAAAASGKDEECGGKGERNGDSANFACHINSGRRVDNSVQA